MLRSFSGFRGVAALVQIGEIKFVIVAPNADQLQTIYGSISSQPFNIDACKKSIVISSSILPEPNNEPAKDNTR